MSAKIALSRPDLAGLVLEALHQVPGLDHLSEISISEINDHDAESNWRVSVLEKDRADIQDIMHIVVRVQNEMRKLYALAA